MEGEGQVRPGKAGRDP